MKYLMAVMMIGALMAPGTVSAAQDPGDAPEHGVARISLLSGDVAVRRGDSGELVDAELNAPLVSRDHIITEDRSRAEVQFDWANLIRVAPDSEVRLADLQEGDFLVQLVTGTVTVRVLRDSTSKIEISTPTVSLVPRDEGSYRITVRDDFSTELTVRSGEAQIFIDNSSDFLRAGQTLSVMGDPSNIRRAYRGAIPLDDWDRFNEDRDRDLARSDSYKYVSRHIYGAEVLSSHGRWVYDAPYGWVWAPNVYAGWAPYRVGRWSWIDYYGWTWISGDPWGWAPYHYGRWYYGPRYGWVWYPGAITVRYTWRPALVGFFGWGINVGWVPLAPYEVYRPWYGPGRTVVVNNVKVVNNFDVINRYHNARFVSGHSGVTSVTYNDFGRNRTTVNNFISGSERDFSRAGAADRIFDRKPDRDRDDRQFSDRRRPERIDASARASRQPIESVRRTEPRRREPAAVERTLVSNNRSTESNRRNENPDTRVLRSPQPNVRRSETSRNATAAPAQPQGLRGRPSDGNRDERSRNENPSARRAEPRTNEPVAMDRPEPSRNRASEGEREYGRVNAPTARRTEPPQRSEPPAAQRQRAEPPPASNREYGRVNAPTARRTEPPQRTEPPTSQPQRAEPPPASNPGARNRNDDNDRPASRGQDQGNPGQGRGNSRR